MQTSDGSARADRPCFMSMIMISTESDASERDRLRSGNDEDDSDDAASYEDISEY